MPTITADKVVNQSIYAKGTVVAYDGTLKNKVATFSNGQLIGKVYSWITATDGNIYWLVYLSPSDYTNFNAAYVKQSSNISLPALPGILEQIQLDQDKKKRDQLGTIPFYIEKYAPYLIGAVVIAVALPSLTQSLANKKVGNMNKQNEDLLTVGAAAVGIYLLTRKKRTGSVIVHPLDPGEYVPDEIQSNSNTTATNVATVDPYYNNQQRIQTIGIFPVIYEQQAIAGRKTFGSKKTN